MLLHPVIAQNAAQGGSPWMWAIFIALVTAVLVLDLGVFHRKAHRVGMREALIWVSVWVTLALLFNLGILIWHPDPDRAKVAITFFTGYVLELSMSVDNVFVFVVIFSYFGVRPELQHRVLFWGILGAVIMRMVFIFLAIEALEHFKWLMYVFGAFLLFTAWKLFFHDVEVHPEKNIVLRITKKFLPVTPEFHGQRFFVREEARKPVLAGAGLPPSPADGGNFARPMGRLVATPLFLVLVLVEATDVVFAVDSVPAILGVTSDRFIAYTSNIFAILGLRSMFFLLAGSLDKFHYLKYGLSLVLGFIGAKMLLHDWVEVPIQVSLLVIVTFLGGSVLFSFLLPPKRAPLPLEPPEPPLSKPD